MNRPSQIIYFFPQATASIEWLTFAVEQEVSHLHDLKPFLHLLMLDLNSPSHQHAVLRQEIRFMEVKWPQLMNTHGQLNFGIKSQEPPAVIVAEVSLMKDTCWQVKCAKSTCKKFIQIPYNSRPLRQKGSKDMAIIPSSTRRLGHKNKSRLSTIRKRKGLQWSLRGRCHRKNYRSRELHSWLTNSIPRHCTAETAKGCKIHGLHRAHLPAYRTKLKLAQIHEQSAWGCWFWKNWAGKFESEQAQSGSYSVFWSTMSS